MARPVNSLICIFGISNILTPATRVNSALPNRLADLTYRPRRADRQCTRCHDGPVHENAPRESGCRYRTRILATAREKFHGRSYADVVIQEICQGATVQEGSFYHSFPSKRDLALAVIDDTGESRARGLVAEAFDRGLPPGRGRTTRWMQPNTGIRLVQTSGAVCPDSDFIYIIRKA
jgi:hypothetical protein